MHFSSQRCNVPNFRLENGNVVRTVEILGKLASMLESWILEGSIKVETLDGIGILNEPWGMNEKIWAATRDIFYPNGYAKVRSYFKSLERSKTPWITIQSAFRYFSKRQYYKKL